VSGIDKIAKDIVLNAFTWEVHGDGSVGVELRGGCKCLSDLNFNAETEVYIRRTIRDHIAFKITETGAKGDSDLIEAERKRNERRAQGDGA
jgi:hypothetical protein